MRTLQTHLEELVKFSSPPPHAAVRVVELVADVGEFDSQGKWRIKAKALHEPQEYEARFQELLGRGYGWVNLTCVGIQDDFLVAGIQVPREVTGVRGGTSVNLSGASVRVRRHGWHFDQYDLGYGSPEEAMEILLREAR
jgi:hypothetical protein